MLSRIANRIQELFTFRSDNRSQKRPSDSSFSNSSPPKKQRLEDTYDMGKDMHRDDALSRPALTRSSQEVKKFNSSYKHSNSTVTDGGVTVSSLNSKSKLNDSASGSRVNGYNFSNSTLTVARDTSFKFNNKNTATSSSKDGRDHLKRPSISDPSKVKDQQPTTSVNLLCKPTTSPSIFKTWTGFVRSTDQSEASKEGAPKSSSNWRSSKTNDNICTADYYLHKKVVPKDLAIKQCFRMDEKRKYKDMLSRYVSQNVLDDVDFHATEKSRFRSSESEEVITISDSENTSEQNQGKGRRTPESPGKGWRSPAVVRSSAGSPACTIESEVGYSRSSVSHTPVPGVQNSRAGSYANSFSGSVSSSRCMGSISSDPWKTLDRKMERATNLLDEISRPTSNRNHLEKILQHDQTKNSTQEEVIVIKDDRLPTSKASFTDRSRAIGSRSKGIAIDTIAIEDSSDSDDSDVVIATINSSANREVSQRFESPRNYARPGLRSLKDFEVSVKTSPFVKRDFLKNLLDKSDVKVRNLKVQETEAEIKELKKNRLEREAHYNDKITNLIRLTRRLPVPLEEKYPEYSEEEDDDDIIIEDVPRDDWPELTDQHEEAVNRAFKCRNPEQVLSDGFKIQITARDIATLQGTNWLNDEVINFYFNLIVDRSTKNKNLPSVYALSTFFYPKVVSGGQKVVRRWTKNIDLFEYKYIVLPVHLGMHWCLAVIDFVRKEIRYYDSMGGTNNRCLDALLQYLVDEMQDKKQQTFDTQGWKKINVKGIPQQMNGSDCGVFSCKFADYITRNAAITFNQNHMPYFRRRMVIEILNQKLL